MRIPLGALILVAALLPVVSWAQSVWTPGYSSSPGVHFMDVAWVGNQAIAVGYKGALWTSPDGLAWTARNTGTTKDIAGVTSNGSRMVAVGAGPIVVRSDDGINWDADTIGSGDWLMSVAWTGKLFVAVGLPGLICTSPDGIQWTRRESGVETWLTKVIWTGTQLVAVGHNGPDLNSTLLTSPDGVEWTVRLQTTRGYLFSVAWTGTHLVAAGDTIVTSPDGIRWTGQKELRIFTSYEEVVWTGSRLVAVGTGYELPSHVGTVGTSTDGEEWTKRINGKLPKLYGVAWTGRRLVAVGDAGLIAVSDDGDSWTLTWDRKDDWNALAHSPSTVVAVGQFGGTALSRDGKAPWEFGSVGRIIGLHDVAWQDTLFMAVGDSGFIYSSPDGRAWTFRPSGSVQAWSAVAAGGSRWVAVGKQGAVSVSADGRTWTAGTVGETSALTDVLWDGKSFVATSSSGTIWSSPDGTAWSRMGAVRGGLDAIAYSGDRYVAVGRDSACHSMDGVTWKRVRTNVTSGYKSLLWTGRQFIASGNYHYVETSPDGLTWTNRTSQAGPALRGMVWTGSLLVAGGAPGILMSAPEELSASVRFRDPRVPRTWMMPLWTAAQGRLEISLAGFPQGWPLQVKVWSPSGKVLLTQDLRAAARIPIPFKGPAKGLLVTVRQGAR